MRGARRRAHANTIEAFDITVSPCPESAHSLPLARPSPQGFSGPPCWPSVCDTVEHSSVTKDPNPMTTVASIFRSRTILLNLLALTYALVQSHGIAVPALDPTVLAVRTAGVNRGMR